MEIRRFSEADSQTLIFWIPDAESISYGMGQNTAGR